MVSYQLLRKDISLDEMREPFTVAQGEVIGVAESRIDENMTLHLVLLVKSDDHRAQKGMPA